MQIVVPDLSDFSIKWFQQPTHNVFAKHQFCPSMDDNLARDALKPNSFTSFKFLFDQGLA